MKLGQRVDAEKMEQMRKLALEGKNALQISKIIDVSPTTAREYIKKWGLDTKEKKGSKYSPKALEEWDRLHEKYGTKTE